MPAGGKPGGGAPGKPGGLKPGGMLLSAKVSQRDLHARSPFIAPSHMLQLPPRRSRLPSLASDHSVMPLSAHWPAPVGDNPRRISVPHTTRRTMKTTSLTPAACPAAFLPGTQAASPLAAYQAAFLPGSQVAVEHMPWASRPLRPVRPLPIPFLVQLRLPVPDPAPDPSIRQRRVGGPRPEPRRSSRRGG